MPFPEGEDMSGGDSPRTVSVSEHEVNRVCLLMSFTGCGKMKYVLLALALPSLFTFFLIENAVAPKGVFPYDIEKPRQTVLAFFGDQISGSVVCALGELIRRYQRSTPSVSIIYEGRRSSPPEGRGYDELLLRRLNAGYGDDLFIVNAEMIRPLQRGGHLLDLSTLPAVTRLNRECLEQSTVDGKILALPLSFTAYGLFSNLELLERYGLSVPSSYPEWLSTCEEFVRKGIVPIAGNKGFALTVPAMTRGLYKIYDSPDFDRLIHDLNEGKTPPSVYMIEGFRLLERFRDSGYITPGDALGTVPFIGDINAFASGKTPFLISTCRTVLELQSRSVPFPYALTSLPVKDKGVITVTGVDFRTCINADSRHLDEAVAFLNFLTARESARLCSSLSCSFPVTNESAVITPALSRLHEQMTEGRQIPVQDFRLRFATWGPIRELGREIFRGLSAEEAAVRYDALCAKQLRRELKP